MYTIAVTGVGDAIGQSILRAAAASNRAYRLVAMDIDPDAAALFPNMTFVVSPHVDDPAYAHCLIEVLKREQVDLLFWGSEREMRGALPHRDYIETATGCRIAVSSAESLAIGMDKLETVRFLKQYGFPFARTICLDQPWEQVQAFAIEIDFPCIIKGRFAGRPEIIRDIEELAYFHRRYEGGVLQEFLGDESSQEYTVGVFYSPEYGVTDTYCMTRKLKHKLTWRGDYRPNSEVEAMCRAAVTALNPCGSINVQLRYHQGRPVIHEFNMRCSSTTVFRALSGWNEVDMAVDYFCLNKRPVAGQVTPGRALRFFQECWVSTTL